MSDYSHCPVDANGNPSADAPTREDGLTFAAFRKANVTRCLKWHPAGIESWSPSDWLTAITGELGELASLVKMRNRERDGLPGNKFSPTQKQIADEIADVLTYLDLFAAAVGVDLGPAAVEKFNEVSERVGFPDRIRAGHAARGDEARDAENRWLRRKLCAVYAGHLAYMDDGEAQDGREYPFIDFLRDSPESIEAAMQERANRAAIAAMTKREGDS